MKIKYRFVFPWTPARGAQLESLGLRVEAPRPPPEIAIGVSHAEEGQEGWSQACQLVREWDGSISISTEFSREEVLRAEYCVMSGRHFSGYPQPEDDFGYRAVTYAGSCDQCGSSDGQVAPFRVRKSLKWGRNDFLQLFWVVDEYFMSIGSWERVLSPLGVKGRQVEDVKGRALTGIVQLNVDHSVEIDMGDARGEVCSTCGRERFSTHIRGFRPLPVGNPDVPIFRSSQIFGAGGMAFNEIIVRQDVVAAIMSSRLRGVDLLPCA